MKILAPYISCIIELGDETVDGITPLEQAIQQGYSQIFMMSETGPVKYHILRPGAGGKARYICLPVKEIPGATLPKVTPGINFLPDGKIPMDLLNEVKEFFRQVIVKKGKALEAMIWILWNEKEGYHLHVPNQTVGHASATYDWSSLPPESTIVVDIHSHADFNAFFSGTDDRDDTNCIRYSGVIGHNDKPERSMKFRFTYHGSRMDVQMTDLFEQKELPKEIPSTWLDKVNVNTPAAVSYPGGNYGNWQSNQSRTYFPVRQVNNNPPAQTSFGFGYGMSGPIHGVQQTGTSNEESTSTQTNTSAQGGAVSKKSIKRELRRQASEMKKQQKTSRHQQGQTTQTSASSKAQDTEGVPPGSRFRGDGSQLVEIGNGALTEEDYNELFANMAGDPETETIKQNARRIIETSFSQEDASDDSLSQQADEYFREIDRNMAAAELVGENGPEMGEFDSIAINHGVDAARAYMAVDLATPTLASSPVLLERSISGMFEVIRESDRLNIFRRLAELLPEKAKDDLAANGL